MDAATLFKKEYLKFESYKNKKMIDLLDESAMKGTKN